MFARLGRRKALIKASHNDMKAMTRMGGILFSLALALACHGAQEPLFEGLGSYTRTITTSSPEAQRYFNQGLAFLHGFNHGAAIRSFQRAAELDPECAMALLGDRPCERTTHQLPVGAAARSGAGLEGTWPRQAIRSACLTRRTRTH